MEQSDKRKTMIKVAKLYYYGNMTQDEIAEMMNLSRPKVSRILTAARQHNIVQIEIKDPLFSKQEMAEKIQSHFNLQKVIITDSGQNIDETKNNIGIATTDFFNTILHDGMNIGIAWGTTLDAFVHRFSTKLNAPNAKIVQLCGGLYNPTMHIDGRELAARFAKKLGCKLDILQSPLLVRNPALKELFMQEPEAKKHFDLFKQLDIAFISVGSSNYKDTVLYKVGYTTAEDAKKFATHHLIDICGHQIDINGYEPLKDLADRHIGISLKDLKNVPLVVALCAGDKKAQSIISGIRGGYIDALIIDEIAAISLLEAEKL